MSAIVLYFEHYLALPLLGRRKWQPTPVFLPGKSHGWCSLVDYSPWGRKESDTTERLHSLTHSFPTRRSSDLVKWALGSTTMKKASGGDGIPVELFQIIKDDAVKVLHSICQQTWKTQQWPQDWKRSVFTPVPKKSNGKECSHYHTIAHISHASKVMLKILQARINNT